MVEVSILKTMADKERIQLNLRLDGYGDLYQAVKDAAARQNTSVNAFVIEALKTAVEWKDAESPSAPSLEAILQALTPQLDNLIEQKLAAKFEQYSGELVA